MPEPPRNTNLTVAPLATGTLKRSTGSESVGNYAASEGESEGEGMGKG